METESQALNIAQQMIDAWLALDWDAVTELFHDDGYLQTVPLPAYQGHKAIRAHLGQVAAGISKLSFDTRVLQASGSVVIFERDDVFVFNGNPGRVSVAGIMEIRDDKLTAWREYFDMQSMMKAMGMA